MTIGRHSAKRFGTVLLFLLLLVICIYGGFFNAGLGIITLSYLALAGYTNINAMNGLKLLISTAVSLTAIILFIIDGMIAWQQGVVVMMGTLVGGFIAAHISKQLSQYYVRGFVIFASCAMTGYFFVATYYPIVMANDMLTEASKFVKKYGNDLRILYAEKKPEGYFDA